MLEHKFEGRTPTRVQADPLPGSQVEPDSICLVDRAWSVTHVNSRAIEEFGGGMNLIGQTFWALFPNLEKSRIGLACHTAMQQQKFAQADDIDPATGQWFSVKALPLPDGLAISFQKIAWNTQEECDIAISERRFYAMFATMTHGVLLHEATGAVYDANVAAERILGVSLQEMRGADPEALGLQMMDESGTPMTKDRMPSEIVLRTGETIRGHILSIFNRQTKERRWLSVEAIPQFEWGSTSPSYVCTLFHDVTEQKNAEKALRESQAHLALAQRVASVGSAFLDFQTDKVTWSDETYRIYGIDKNKFGHTLGALLEIVHPEDRDSFAEGLEQERRGVQTPPTEFRIVRPDGAVRVLHRVSQLMRNDAGQVIGVLATNRDVTEQKQAEAALRHSQAHLALAQRVAQVGSTFIDFKTGIWEWSDETYRLLGISKGEITPGPTAILDMINADDRKIFEHAMQTALAGDIPYPIEFRIRRRDGSERIFYQEADVIRDESGAVTGAILTRSDITDLRLAEKERQTLQNQLYHAQRLDSLGTLAGGIAHDLNNTLVPILGLSEAMLKEPNVDEGQRPLLEVIHQAGTRARDLVSRILTFSRRENPNNRVLDLAAFMHETMRLARATIPTTITIQDRIEKVPPIYGDSGQLHQVILNLIANAAHAIGENLGTITVTVDPCENALDEQGKKLFSSVRISVEDTGIGMDAETQKRIFEPFFTTKKVGVGTGLGLSVVHGIVAAHGGRIEVSSELGRGSRFTIYLPVTKPESV